ncbi:glycoside hydrolase family 9 protein [Spirosoma oryzicola]|uniref:glycoside hydrolase family 9 protein n=1 Tax=Spirosoma oryzicola TaxID=2898794 RepID=UPI001E649915|nr:glycoside hydrolase family 9 protein [Spirosoma oryzicola]UHG90388.1 glycoside hydrolase family 9 protein [Spirosoma oryzicola]
MNKRLKPAVLCFLALNLLGLSAQSQSLSESIRLNQIGYYPNAAKIAVVVGEAQGSFQVATPDLKKTLFTGTLGEPRKNVISGKTTRTANFSSFTKAGTYVLVIPGTGHSYPFEIRTDVHKPVATGALKGFYYQRVSTDLPAKFAGKWARPAGHPDTRVLIHPSAASADRPAGAVISSPRGWYDAGDYNKYIVNSGITMGTLLSLYEDFPAYTKSLNTNIPESTNKIPDLLDEALWNLRWMLTMQDPADGGVYHKLTNPSFDGMVMPDKAVKDRYVVQKSITAALDFAAVMAQAGRVYKAYNRELPGLADSCVTAAKKAWTWAKANPNAVYKQSEMNTKFDPDVVTGSYEDHFSSDEWIWAAAELYVTTKDDSYYKAVNLFPDAKTPLPSWPQVRTLAYYTLARFGNELTDAGKQALPVVKQHLTTFADSLILDADKQAFQTVMGKSAKDFIWGSSAEAANQGIALLQAYRFTDSPKRNQYLRYALSNLDYLLGRNAVGYSFVTGFGDKTPMHPHHRPSVADGIDEPVPGLLSGGTNANAARQDKCAGYTSTVADEVFIDADCSYASNEIAINWNAPLVYLATALEALQKEQKTND